MTVAGWAGTSKAHADMLAYLPPAQPSTLLEDEPAAAVCDWWEPPDQMALPEDLCLRLIERGQARAETVSTANGTYYLHPTDEADEAAILDRVKAANRLWWRLDVHRWEINVKHYGPGQQHPEHTDWHPAGGACRKLVAGVQLSAPDTYTGGEFRFNWWGRDLELPRTRGTLTVFPSWIYHRVTPVTAGERWALIVNGWGPPLR